MRSELDRHPTHRSASADCATGLLVEEIQMAARRFLTGRIGAEVPHRVRVDPDAGIDAALAELLTIVLHNDPIRLEGPSRPSWLVRRADGLRRRGVTLYGVEVFQRALRVGGRTQSQPGVALRLRREAGDVHLGLVIGLSADVAGASEETRLEAAMTTAVEVAVFASELADTSVYGAARFGLAVQRFEGPATRLSPGTRVTATDAPLAAGLRAGVELLRTTDMRFDLFVDALLPVLPARDLEAGVVDAWVPMLAVGAGAPI